MKKNINLVKNLYKINEAFVLAFKGVDYNEYLLKFGYMSEWEYSYQTEYLGEKNFAGNYEDCSSVEDFHCEAALDIAEHIQEINSEKQKTIFQRNVEKLQFELKSCYEMTGVDLLKEYSTTITELKMITKGGNKKLEIQQIFNIYVDGSFDTKTNRYGWSFVVFDEDNNIVAQDCGVGDAKNVWDVGDDTKYLACIGVLSAAMRATKWATQCNAKIKLHSTCRYVEYYAKGWFKTNFSAAKKYKEFMNKYYKDVVFIHIEKHYAEKSRDIEWLCDRLLDVAWGYMKDNFEIDVDIEAHPDRFPRVKDYNNILQSFGHACSDFVSCIEEGCPSERIFNKIKWIYTCAERCKEVAGEEPEGYKELTKTVLYITDEDFYRSIEW